MAERVEPNADHPLASVIGIVGGTGELGRGLATRWAAAGARVVIGSRDESRAAQVAAEISGDVTGHENRHALAISDIAVLTVPWSAHDATLTEYREDIGDRLLIDCVNPLGFDARGPFALAVAAGSAVEQAAALLPTSTVVGAFHHLAASALLDPLAQPIDSDVMVVGDDRPAVEYVLALAELLPGVRGVYAGRQRNARQVEALTANLIAVNRRYRSHSGIRVTGLNRD